MSNELHQTEETTTNKSNILHSKFGGFTFLISAFLLLCLTFHLKSSKSEETTVQTPQLIAISGTTIEN